MPIKAIILNNDELGKISKEQRAGEWDVWATDLKNPHFADYAKGCGAFGKRITNQEEIESSMKELFKADGPGVLELITDVNLI